MTAHSNPIVVCCGEKRPSFLRGSFSYICMKNWNDPRSNLFTVYSNDSGFSKVSKILHNAACASSLSSLLIATNALQICSCIILLIFSLMMSPSHVEASRLGTGRGATIYSMYFDLAPKQSGFN